MSEPAKDAAYWRACWVAACEERDRVQHEKEMLEMRLMTAVQVSLKALAALRSAFVCDATCIHCAAGEPCPTVDELASIDKLLGMLSGDRLVPESVKH